MAGAGRRFGCERPLRNSAVPPRESDTEAPSKLAYYKTRGIPRELARGYFRHFGPVSSVLDVGCGTGDLGRYRPPGDVSVHGVDVDPGAVEVARAYEQAVCLDLEVSLLPYDSETFDAVLARDILEHLEDPARIVREIFRVLRPRGVLVASVIMARPSRVWDDYTHVRGFTRRSARLLLEDAGFSVEGVWRMGGVPLSNRLRFMALVPYILKIPGINQLCASSWELRARKS